MRDTQLIHVRVPVDIIQALDKLDSDRSRADKVSEALAEYVRKRVLLDAIDAGAASLSPEEARNWHSDDAVDSWVRDRRAEYERKDPS